VKFTPVAVDEATMVFGGRINELLPPYADIPDDFKHDYHPWVRVVVQWFYRGLGETPLQPVDTIDRSMAIRHLATVMGSFAPKHEHKIAGVAYLMSLWFKPIEGAETVQP
jgi:hypothetical protein